MQFREQLELNRWFQREIFLPNIRRLGWDDRSNDNDAAVRRALKGKPVLLRWISDCTVSKGDTVYSVVCVARTNPDYNNFAIQDNALRAHHAEAKLAPMVVVFDGLRTARFEDLTLLDPKTFTYVEFDFDSSPDPDGRRVSTEGSGTPYHLVAPKCTTEFIEFFTGVPARPSLF